MSKVYYTQEVSAEALIRAYEALNTPATGRVAIKISSGEPGGQNYLQPELIKDLVNKVSGTIAECNATYSDESNTTQAHLEILEKHGFTEIAKVDIFGGDENSSIKIPVEDTKHIKYNIVGAHIQNYDFIINLTNFRGHKLAGFGGVLENQSIGLASSTGKTYIHSAGKTENTTEFHPNLAQQDDCLESMAAAAQSIHSYMKGHILYINVMNNISIDCDCDKNPEDPEMLSIGIFASLDPVAVDQACVDQIFNRKQTEGDNRQPLIDQINQQHGLHILEYAEQIGLGSRKYELISLDLDDLLKKLDEGNYSCLIRNHGETRGYRQRGVRDLYHLVTSKDKHLDGAIMADKVIGHGAAAMITIGGVKNVITHVISKPALALFQRYGVNIKYETLVDHIINHQKTDRCPLEKRLDGVSNLEDYLPIVTKFIQDLKAGRPL